MIQTRFVFVTILLLCFFMQTQAQLRGQEWNSTSYGRGTLKISGQRDEFFNRARLNLLRNGEAEIQIFGEKTYTFYGRWSRNRTSTIDLNIEEAFGRAEPARGTLRFRANGELERFDFTGSGIRPTYSLTFESRSGTGGSQGANFIGIYRSVVQVREGREDYTMVRILRIKEDKSVELVSRYKGSEPQVNRNSIRRFGDLLQEIRNRKTILHTGTWSIVGRRLEINLTTLDGGREATRMQFELAGQDLTTIYWDKQTYGTEGFNFKRSETTDEDDGTQPDNYPPAGDLLIGKYSVTIQSYDGRATIERTLDLQAAGQATLTTRWRGAGRPRFSNRDVDELGRIIVELEEGANEVVHSGTWRRSGNELTINFDRLNNSRDSGSIVFTIRSDGFQAIRFDENQYGTREFFLTRVAYAVTPDPYGQGATPQYLVGRYSTNLRVPETTGDIERVLELSPNGSATFTTEWLGGGQPQFGFRATRELGNLLKSIERTRQPVSQYGRWSFINNSIVVRLTSTAASNTNIGNRVDVRETTVVFRVRDNVLEAENYDQEIYGSRAFSLYSRRR
ncbi:MAG: hypothetical protein AB1757_15345 [Acidobacteriota bacterium]